MLKIHNIDKVIGEVLGKYKIYSVKDFTNSYSFAVLDTDINRYFRIDLMKQRHGGYYSIRYTSTKYFKIADTIVQNKSILISDIIFLIEKHRKPIKIR
jgi:hypothetical protein